MRLNLRQGICAPAGFTVASAGCGLRRGGGADIALVCSERPATAAGLFTQNRVQAAPVHYARQALAARQPVHAVLINAGNANACTGHLGRTTVRASARAVAQALGCRMQAVLVASTGVIGVPLPAAPLVRAVPALVAAQRASAAAGLAAARAIMTTDTRPKQCALHVHVGGVRYTLGGMAKGAGMIHPNMATMLGVLTCDAPLTRAQVHALLAPAVRASFNAVSVDGDTSTNDCVFMLANGAAGPARLPPGALAALAAGVRQLCLHLAQAIAADGEGACRLLVVHVSGAHSAAAALQLARTVVASSLVKTAVAGGDPNWGRVVAAAGRAGVPLRANALSLDIGGHTVLAAGQPRPQAEAAAARHLTGRRVELHLTVGGGRGAATAFGCDLTQAYVRINAHYRT